MGVQTRTLAIDLIDDAGEVIAATADLEVGLLIYNAGANSCSEEFLDAGISRGRCASGAAVAS